MLSSLSHAAAAAAYCNEKCASARGKISNYISCKKWINCRFENFQFILIKFARKLLSFGSRRKKAKLKFRLQDSSKLFHYSPSFTQHFDNMLIYTTYHFGLPVLGAVLRKHVEESLGVLVCTLSFLRQIFRLQRITMHSCKNGFFK